jgi:hypothetical protein
LFAGEVDFKLLSWVTLFSVLIQGAIVAATIVTLKERIEKVTDASANFNDSILEIGCILCFLPAFLGPLNHLPESGKKARFLKEWRSLQVKSYHYYFILYPVL